MIANYYQKNILDMEKSSLNAFELKRLREKSYELEKSNMIIKGHLDESTWNQIMEYVTKHERQIGFITKSLRQGKALWKDLTESVSNLFEDISEHLNEHSEKKEDSILEEQIGTEFADAMFYIDIQAVLPGPQQQYDSKEGCAGGICYTLRNMQAKIWWKLCVATMFQYGETFDKFYKNLGNTEDALEKFVERNPSMLFNSMSTLFVKRLHEKMSWGKFHSLLMSLKDEDGRTFIYHETNPEIFVEFYTSVHRADLYTMLKVQDKNGQTALHYNPSGLSKFLIYSFSPPGCETSKQFFELLNMKDIYKKTAIHYANDVAEARISWLANQAETGCYALYRPSVAILFNTEKRPGATSEIYLMFRTLEAMGMSPYRYENFDKKSIFEAIDEAASRTRTALIIFLMAHGSKGKIFDVNGNVVYLKLIQDRMCSYEHLKEKPKILIVQCCQGLDASDKLFDHGCEDGKPPAAKILDDCPPFIPDKDHFSAYMACVEGQPAPRNVFIPAIARQIDGSAKTTSLHEIFEAVKVQLAEEGQFNIPIMHSTLHGKICLKNSF